MAKNKGEPSLDKIDDYNGNESKQKRNTVRLIIILLLVVGAVLTYFKQPIYEEAKIIEEKTQIPVKNNN
ncbi:MULTISPECIES: hypothetical protein [Arcobacteraceae]|uniref:Uncharacterized protein n=2 Tax=Aliarcobacter thereius TaxID=544718 RepID=A0A1C0B7K0_9BACT|nr:MULTISPECIES: hypothetical protein [Arcobacteraceae]OCL85856.1 hypothetical protein AAX30_01686 [Arcobacter porcinus]OCL87861.1 hypothetical protein AAX26_00954 [Aliarcobacter thereius]OCL94116.1 hypothetical protein AAX25_00443 [Aliarcobacter thereius]OCL95510.1 hypothetical protein AA347_00971 [Aliarcobacter thereius LMG 24486]OCL99579.1 hypothetical protein AAX29_00624 [Aliarcobacter thereius]